MRIGKTFAGTILLGGLLAFAGPAAAAPPADDFLNPQTPGPRLTLMPFVGPGFRAVYDHRFQVEKDMSEVRTQLMATVAIPFTEVSANIDARFFLMTFGASVGYHNEWHLLQFQPDPKTGRDRAGQPVRTDTVVQGPPVPPDPEPTVIGTIPDPTKSYTDLHRDARAMKSQTADVQHKAWLWYEGRWGFLWPAYNFMGSSTFAARQDGRPDVSYDWEFGTVYNGGLQFRWEGYFLFRERNTGFIGPALRAFYVPRNRVKGDFTIAETGMVVPDGAACQGGTGIRCIQSREFEFHYGLLAGIRPNWVDSSDLFLLRTYATWGLNNKLFGTHTFRQPLQILAAYMVDFDL